MPFREYEIQSQHISELNQATLRVVIAIMALSYVSMIALFFGEYTWDYLFIALYYLGFLLTSILLRFIIKRNPGIFLVRRMFTMIHDYVAISVGLAVGEEKTLPIYAVMVWVTLGYGVRYGAFYLLAATIMSFISLSVIVFYNDYWSNHLYMVLALLLTTVVIPVYAKTLLTQVRQASTRALKATHTKAQLLAQVSHDLRQPIHAIGIYITCLREENLNPSGLKMVDNIDRSLVSVSHIFHSMLNFYTLDSGGINLKPEVFRLRNMLEECIKEHTVAAHEAGSQIRLDVEECWVKSDVSILIIIINNLISNAVKYGEGKLISLRSFHKNGSIMLAICDKGSGIEEKHLLHIFDEFFRIKKNRDKDLEGIGLGLSIVKRACSLAGLDINLVSRVGLGTCAVISNLKIASTPVVQDKPQEKLLMQLSGTRVFLIEDNPEMLDATQMLLQRWGCEVLPLESQDPTLLDTQCECDVIIADYDLGTKISGIEYIQAIRNMKAEQIPALLITGHDVTNISIFVKDLNIEIVSKPIKPVELRSVLTDIVRKTKAI
ncbi:hybrid sensor histidine kinase/response regulator [Enterobacter sp. 638]|nr:hybrid sensor histidine kinase/response regulator [Enterobacter sp. 638]